MLEYLEMCGFPLLWGICSGELDLLWGVELFWGGNVALGSGELDLLWGVGFTLGC